MTRLAAVGDEQDVLPSQRYVWLAGRGRTSIREAHGPAGAPTIVLLHGWTATADLSWASSYAPLAEHFNVVAIDHRGHGRGIRSETSFRLVDCADDVAALVEQLGCGPVIPVGYSMGGAIAQLFCHRHPELASGMVLCATSCLFSGTLREDVLFSLAAGTSVLAGALPLATITTATLGLLGRLNTRRGRDALGLEQIGRHDWKSIVEASRELGRFDSRSWIGEIDVPAAVVVTDDDDVVPVRRQEMLIEGLGDPAVFHIDGGHRKSCIDPISFVPALVDACRAVAARNMLLAA